MYECAGESRVDTMGQILDGIRVIDFGQYIAGPLTAMFLADHGADVVRVDPPGGPRWDTPANAVWNRGKRRITLGLKRSDDVAIARQLVAGADVVIENFRPGVMDRLGLGAAAMTTAAPRLVYCSLPGFASDDPRAALPAWEGVVGAASGMYRSRTGDGASFTAIPIASTFAALVAATSIASALYSREHDGRGQRIEVPLFDAMFEAIGANGMFIDGKVQGKRPNDFGGGIFQCSDGRWVQLMLAKPHFIERFVTGAGLTDRFDLDGLRSDREVRQALLAALPEIVAGRTADEWEEFGDIVDVPLIKIRSAAEWLECEHGRASGSVLALDDPEYGPMTQPNSPVRLSRNDVPSAAAHRLDEDRESILAELAAHGAPATPPGTPPGTAPGEASDAALPAPRSAALEGVTVLDLSQVLAGPMAGRTLAEFGASVVKVNPPNEAGAGIRMSLHRYHTDVNRAKESMLLDLKQPGGLDVAWRLIEASDVVVHNFRAGVMERLGLSYEEASRRRPGIIYISVSTYGAGPWGGRPGYEPFGQAVTGVSLRQGGDGRPGMQPYAVNDYGTGLSAALAATLALFHRARTGEGQEGAAALAYTGAILQSPYGFAYEGKRWDEPQGPDARGHTPLQRLYEASDGWLFLAATPSQLPALAGIDGLNGLDALSDGALEAELEARLRTRPAADWCALITGQGIGAHVLVPIADLMVDPWVVAHGLSVTRLHDTGEQITTVGPAARLARTPVTAGRPAASPGADGVAVLTQIGLAEQVEELQASGALSLTMPPWDA